MSPAIATRINTGIEEGARKTVAEGLSRVLADSYTLYLKTHNFHWNVTGPNFNQFHLLFETQYTELATAVDEIAERIRALGFPAPGSYAEFGRLSAIKEAQGVPKANDMVRQLLQDHETTIGTLRSVLQDAEQAGDDVSVDLLTQRLQIHEKTAWMLRSQLEE